MAPTCSCFARLAEALKHNQCAVCLSHHSPFALTLSLSPPLTSSLRVSFSLCLPLSSPPSLSIPADPLLDSLLTTSHSPSTPAMQNCTGSKAKDSAPCPCTSFAPRPPPKDGRCDSCGHQRSAHLEAPSSDNKYVQRLLKGLAATAVHEEARKETLDGFRPKKQVRLLSPRSRHPHLPPPQPNNPKGKASIRRSSARIATGYQPPRSGSVKIGRIVVFPCGVEVPSTSADIPLANIPIPSEPGPLQIPSHQYFFVGPMGICRASSRSCPRRRVGNRLPG